MASLNTPFTWNTLQISKYIKFKDGDRLYRYAEIQPINNLTLPLGGTLNALHSATYYVFGNTVFYQISANITPNADTFVFSPLPYNASNVITTTYGVGQMVGATNGIVRTEINENDAVLIVKYDLAIGVPYEVTVSGWYPI